jgi:hypothetical protein
MISMPWKVDGPEFDIHDGYLLKMPGVIDTNLRIIDRYAKKFRLISQLVRNPRELTVYENVPAVKPRIETMEPPTVNTPSSENSISEIPFNRISAGSEVSSMGFGYEDR